MRFSFVFKLAVSLLLLSVSVTGISVGIIYNNTKEMVLEQIQSRLLDIGRAGAYIIGEQERRDIAWLRKEYEKNVIFKPDGKTKSFLLGKDGELGTDDDEVILTLPEAKAQQLMESPQFLRVVQTLRKIREGSRENVRPLGEVPPLHIIRKTEQDEPSMEYIYLLTTLPGAEPKDYLVYLVDADYLPVKDDGHGEPYEGNSIGNLTLPLTPEMSQGFSGKPVAEHAFSEDQWGDIVLSGYVPVLDQKNNILAVLGMDYNAKGAANKLRTLYYICLAAIAAAMFFSLIFAIVVAKFLHKPIRILNEGAKKVAAGDYSVQVEVKSRDELGTLANTFNTMVTEIRANTTNLTQLNEAYERFVPKEFLRHLGKDDIKKLKLGDQVQREMAVLFSDIRSFTTLSEQMTPHDNFEFLNSYLQRVSPKIRAHSGFIDKFIGDAIMALFPNHIDDALSAAIDMQHAVAEYNVKRVQDSFQPIRIGVGVHIGMLMLGTIGEEMRMEGTVISDAVNLASRLEGLTKRFGVQIMTSEHALESLNGNKDKYHTRYLGRVRVKGKKEPTRVYEVMNCDPQPMLEMKLKTMQKFEEGIQLFNQGKFGDAMKVFQEILQIYDADKPAQVYMERCRRMVQN